MILHENLNRLDRYLWHDLPCKYWSDSSWSTDGNGRKYNVQVDILFDEGTETERVYFDPTEFKIVYDHRIRARDLVDIRRENGITLRGTIVEIKPEEKLPYLVAGNGSSVWMAAHEFERFVRADAPERAYKTLTAVRARIDVLEAELTALKLTEEVLEGVYV